jgi:ribosomal protein S18 acetylase RimI-like enzyme
LRAKLDIPGSYSVRRLKEEDLVAAFRIFEESFDEPTVKRAKLNYRQYFAFGHDDDTVECNKHHNWISVEYYIVENNDDIVGTFGLYAMSWSPTSYWLGWIAIAPEHRRKGIGTSCLKMAEEMARQKGARLFCLETSQLYDEAIEFYVSQDFKPCGRIDKYYGKHEPLLIFSKRL